MSRIATIVLVAAGLLLGASAPAAAQLSLGPINGVLAGHLGGAIGQDGVGSTLSVGASIAVIEQSGWGAEFDAGFANDDDGRTGGLDAQSYILNVIGMWPRGQLRPFLTAGGGVIRARTCIESCASTQTWTDWALSGGGGVQYVLNESFGLRGEVRYVGMVSDHPDPGRDRVRFWRVAGGATFHWVAD